MLKDERAETVVVLGRVESQITSLKSERDEALARVKALESHLSAQYKVLENQLGDLVSGEKENAKLRRLLDRHRANGHILTEELKAQS